jgi:hypothetical protein
MGIAAALAGAAGLLMLHWVRGSGWPWLLIAGTLLTGVLFTLSNDPFLSDETIFAFLGAGPILTLLGLIGAGGWLLPHFQTAGSAVIGVAIAAPLVGVVFTAILAPGQTPAELRAWLIMLASVGVAGGLGRSRWCRPCGGDQHPIHRSRRSSLPESSPPRSKWSRSPWCTPPTSHPTSSM